MKDMAEDIDDKKLEDATAPEPVEEDENSEAEVDSTLDDEGVAESELDDEAADAEESDGEEDDGDLIVTIGEDSPPSEEDDVSQQDAPDWVKKLRKQHKDTAKENKELKRQLEAMQTEKKPVELRAKPTLESHDFDADAYEADLLKWHDEKREQKEIEKAKQDEAEKQQKAWQSKLESYREKSKTLNVKDFDDVEDDVRTHFSTTQQGIVIEVADNPALTVYALGKNDAELQRLAEIQNPIQFAAAVVRLEAKMKTTRRKPATQPERRVKSGAPRSGGTNLKKLHEQAQKTGNYDAYLKAKREAQQ